MSDYSLTLAELQALYRLFISTGYISHDDEEVHNIVNKIMKIVDDHEKLARRDSKSTC